MCACREAQLLSLKSGLRNAFSSVHGNTDEAIWDAPFLTVREYSKEDVWYTLRLNLIYVINIIIADATDFLLNPTNYHDNKSFRFVTDNAVTVATPELQRLMRELDDDNYAQAATFIWVQVVNLVVLAITLTTLGLCVFGRALSRVQNIKRGVVEIAANLPPLTIARMRRNAQRASTFVRRARIKADQAVNQGNDEVAERGVGDVKGFTYDAELEGKPWQHDAPPALEEGPAYAGYGDLGRYRLPAVHLDKPPMVVEPASSYFESQRTSSRMTTRSGGSGGVTQRSGLASAPSIHSEDSKQSTGSRVRFAQTPTPTPEPVSAPGLDAKHLAPPAHDLPKGVAAHGSLRQLASPPAAPIEAALQLSPRLPLGASRGQCPVAHKGEASMGGAVCPVSMRTTSPSSISSAKHGERRLPGTRSTGGAMGGGECPVTHRRTSQGGTCPIVGHTVQGTATLRRRANHMLLNSEGSNGSDVRDVASTETAGDGSQNEQSAGDVAHVSFAPSTAVPTTARVPDIAHILQASPGAIVCTDAIGTILYANPAFTALTGYTVEEALGKNVTILQPQDLAERHDDIMRRVVDGGTPRVIGKAGRQLAVIPKSGEDRPMLLALGRLDVEDTTYFVADIADISQAVKGNDGEQHEEEEESQGRSNLLRWLRVCGALLLVALLQCLNVYNGGTSMLVIAQRASEFTYASRLKALSSLLTCVPSCATAPVVRCVTHNGVRSCRYSCREAAIGDGELWTAPEAGAFMREHLEEFSAIRFGLRYGDENRRLVGALGRDPRQYALQFDTVTIDGVIVQGLDALLAFRERDIDACIRRFQGGGDSVGPNYAALEAIPDWSAVRDMHYGKFALMLDQSEDLYMEEAQGKIDSTVLTDRLINVFNCMLILILYVNLMHGCVPT